MLIEDAAREFCIHLDAERGCSPATIAAYTADIRTFSQFLSGIGSDPTIEAVTVKTVRDWMAEMASRDLRASTRARRLAGLRSMFDFLLDCEITTANPCRRVRSPRREKQPPVYLSPTECRALLDATDANHYTVLAFRDRAILSIVMFAGLRRNELVNLRVEGVDLPEGTLRVTVAKGKRGRIVPLAPEALAAVADWLELRPDAPHDYLFTTRAGQPMSTKDLHRMFHRTLERSGITRDGITLHKLRHTCATLLLQQGVDIATLQRLLGHVSIESTATYLHVEMDDLREAVRRHPLGAL